MARSRLHTDSLAVFDEKLCISGIVADAQISSVLTLLCQGERGRLVQ